MSADVSKMFLFHKNIANKITKVYFTGMRVGNLNFPRKICRIFSTMQREVLSTAWYFRRMGVAGGACVPQVHGQSWWKLELHSSLTSSKELPQAGETRTLHH